MNKFAAGFGALFLLVASVAFAQNAPNTGGLVPNAPGASPSGPLVSTPAQVFNITDYGAVCDGTTNDNTAINAALTAAATSAAYVAGNAVGIIGPQGVSSKKSCVINSLNFTQFASGSGTANNQRVQVSGIQFLCTGAGNICLDGLNADYLDFHDVSLMGASGSNAPEIGVQVGIGTQNTSSAWHVFANLNITGEFSLAALYNVGSENFNCIVCALNNQHTANGPVAALGSITGGSSYTNGTYTGVALTGGSGSGAKATIVVSGNVVSSVTLTNQGRDYVPTTDTLSAAASTIGGTGSGFSIPVSTVTPYTVILDGQNHWNVTSSFATVTLPVDTWESFTHVNFKGGSIRQNGAGRAAIWAGRTMGARFDRVYTYGGTATVSYCVELFDNGVAKSGPATGNSSFYYDGGCEGGVSGSFFITGANATPSLVGLTIREPAELATSARPVFVEDTNITGITVSEMSFQVDNFNTSGAVVFKTPTLWTITGEARVGLAENWNSPTFAGVLTANGQRVTEPVLGPLDVYPVTPAGAYSCTRRLKSTYTGKLCNFQRASDSTNTDVGFDGAGNLNQSTYNTFCASTTCTVRTMYDQSGNTNTATNTTAASQPTFTLSDSNLGKRPATVFGDGTAACLTVTQASTINQIFAAGGLISIVADQTITTPLNADRILFKDNGSTLGWEFSSGTSSHTALEMEQYGGGTEGTWTTGVYGSGGRIIDELYNSSALANVPTIAVGGVASTLTSTQPTTSIGSDATLNLLIGNNACTSGTRGAPFNFGEIILWASQPSSFILELMRQNQAAYYGLTTQ